MIRINFETGDFLDIPSDNLIGWDFSGLNLHRAIFDGMCLDEAKFRFHHLSCMIATWRFAESTLRSYSSLVMFS